MQPQETATFQTFIGMASWMGLIRMTAEFGSEALAGYAIAVRVILFKRGRWKEASV
jgi:hypothetical protein